MRSSKVFKWMLWSVVPLIAILVGYYYFTGEFPAVLVGVYMGGLLGPLLVNHFFRRRKEDEDEAEFW